MTTIRQTSLRWAVLLAALLALMAGAATGAKASTGGASTTTASAPGGDLAFSPFRYAGASWYGGPSMWGRTTACGKTPRPGTPGGAPKTLPRGPTVKFVYHRHALLPQGIDRGPHLQGGARGFTQAARGAGGLGGG